MTQIKGDLKKMYVLGVDGDTAHVTIGYLNQTLHFYLLKTGKQEKWRKVSKGPNALPVPMAVSPPASEINNIADIVG